MSTTLIGESPKFKTVSETAARVAVSDTAVLITGDSGSGKEMLARYIHDNSPRKDKPFIVINISAFPDTLLENELFGHVAGAYTDATDDYTGKIGQAEGGTILLDEIGDIPIGVQAKLLRFMQERVYEPLGSNEVIKSDVRIISSTAHNLYNLLRDGRLREDLYYRFNIVHLSLPSLSERVDDIPLLTKAFITECSARQGKNVVGVDDEVAKVLSSYKWPGNVRQLYNVIDGAIAVATENVLHLADLDKSIISDESADNEIIPLKDAVANFKKDYLTKALQVNSWSQKKTAEILQIERTYLNRLIKTLKITRH